MHQKTSQLLCDPWPCHSSYERDRSLQYARQLCRELKRKLEIVLDPKYTELSPGAADVLQIMLDFHTQEIQRLSKIKFTK